MSSPRLSTDGPIPIDEYAQDNDDHPGGNQVENLSSSVLLQTLPLSWDDLLEDFHAAMAKQRQVEQDIQNETENLMRVSVARPLEVMRIHMINTF